MAMHLRETLSNRWDHVQNFLFPHLRDAVGPMTPLHQRVAFVFDFAAFEACIRTFDGLPGRPLKDRFALARAFVAKAVMNISTTTALIERLCADAMLRRLCGWERAYAVPSESTFSRAFAEFAVSGLPTVLHEALIAWTHKDRLVGHISRDSTAIEAREKPERSAPKAKKPKGKRGRRKKEEPVQPKEETVQPKEEKRLDRQVGMSPAQMLADLPTACNVGSKRNAKGHTASWIGYKLHVDTADGDIPVSCILTSASLHDSQVALPLAAMTARYVTNLYVLMDKAYDAPQIWNYSRALGQVPIIAKNPRRGGKEEAEAETRARRLVGHPTAEDIRFKERSAAERFNSNLKDNYGGRFVRVRGPAKVMCHLMFGVLVVAATQIIRLVT